MRNTLLLCCLPIVLFSQRNAELAPISLEYGIGTMSSFSAQPYSYGCGLSRCPPYEENFIPVTTRYFCILVNYHLLEKHKLGVGISLSEHGFLRSINFLTTGETYSKKALLKYKSLKMRHLIKLLQSKSISFGIGNSLEVEFLEKEFEFFDTRKTTLSHLLEANVGLNLFPDLEIYVGLLYRTDIIQSSAIANSGKFTRFGKGAIFGLCHRF